MEAIINLIHKYVCFEYPFGWEELGVVATVAAVIVALVSNRSARKQLIAALKMQEQSKNVSLLEERLKIAEAIRENEAVSAISVRVLYNDEIFSEFQILQELESQHRQALADGEVYFDALKANAGSDVVDKIREYTGLYLERSDCPKTYYEEFQNLCSQHIQYWSVTGFSNDQREYNYYEIYTTAVEINRRIVEKRENIVLSMEKFLSDSIMRVNSTNIKSKR